jgi:hypothetical protein
MMRYESSDLKRAAQIRRGNRKVAGGELGGGAMARIGLPSPEFIARATPGTIRDGTSTGSKREVWRTHLARLERRKSVKEGVRLPKAAVDLLCTAARQRKPSKRKLKGERVGRLRINDPHPSVTYGGGQTDEFIALLLSLSGGC